MPATINLKEYLHPQMDLLFVALNAPEVSNENAHWFTYNLSFWNVLFNAGIIIKPIADKLQGDVTVFGTTKINYNNWVIGVTDLNREVVDTNSLNVTTNEDQVNRIKKIIDTHPTKRICLMHGMVAEEFEKQGMIKRNYVGGKNQYGKVGQYKNTAIFEVPFHNAAVPNTVSFYKLLIQFSETNEVEKIEEASQKEQATPQTITDIKDVSGAVFYLPDVGNSITDKDITKGTLRITASAASWFPNQSTTVQIQVNGKMKTVAYEKKDSRSDLLKIGKDFMQQLGLKPNGRLKFTRQLPEFYKIEKA